MFIARVNRAGRRAFTLLEITLAVAILAMMSLAIYRFVQTNLTAMRVSADQGAVEARYSGLVSLLTTQWQSLPHGMGTLMGEPFKFGDRPRDEVTWICSAGPGLLTRYASGDYSVTMRLRPMQQGREKMEIGFARKFRSADGGGDGPESWIPLIDDVQSLQIRYFNMGLNSWVDRWTDTSDSPRLVRLSIGRPDRNLPWEVVIALGRTSLLLPR